MLTKASIPYEILEASDRVGGRVYTYDFPADSTTAHNYYDVGAMRIPDVPAMKMYFCSLLPSQYLLNREAARWICSKS
jgi:monoamine oxidase